MWELSTQKHLPVLTYRRADRSFNTVKPGSVPVPATRPRNIERPFRGDDDEPADRICFIASKKISICQDGRDRTRCSKCNRGIQFYQPVGTDATTRDPDLSLASHPAISPDRVFRDLLTTQVDNPLKPSVKVALLEAFSQARHKSNSTSSQATPANEPTFHLFPHFPFEIRRLIWEKALPTRLLYHSDLSRSYPGDATTPTTSTQLPYPIIPSHAGRKPHSINELWRSDLFYTCTEARSVVVSAARGSLRIGRTSKARLAAGLDELYFPWLGRRGAFFSQTIGEDSLGDLLRHLSLRKRSNDTIDNARPQDCKTIQPSRNGSGPPRSWTKQVQRLEMTATRLPVLVLDVGWLDSMHPATLEYLARGELEVLRVVVADIVMSVPLSASSSALKEETSGMDLTTIVDLYDDTRIREMLSLCGGGVVEGGVGGHEGGRSCDGFNGLNKAARHLCIECTRRRWEGRRWERYRRVFGAYLKRLCRPSIVFSVTFEWQ